MKNSIILFLLSCCLSSCTKYASDAEHQYLTSRNGPDLIVPAPLQTSNLSDFYRLPAPTGDVSVSILPP